jgi:xylose isomerase
MNDSALASDSPYFSFKRPLRFQGERFAPSDDEPFAYRWYDKDRVVLGKRME